MIMMNYPIKETIISNFYSWDTWKRKVSSANGDKWPQFVLTAMQLFLIFRAYRKSRLVMLWEMKRRTGKINIASWKCGNSALKIAPKIKIAPKSRASTIQNRKNQQIFDVSSPISTRQVQMSSTARQTTRAKTTLDSIDVWKPGYFKGESLLIS